jgi:hypothetical protein
VQLLGLQAAATPLRATTDNWALHLTHWLYAKHSPGMKTAAALSTLPCTVNTSLHLISTTTNLTPVDKLTLLLRLTLLP